jgi:flagellar hook-associated protein 3 FlgL
MRITNPMVSDTVLRNLQNNLAELERLQNQLTSGKRLSRPSDDPPAVETALNYHATIAAGEQYLRNMDSSSAWLQATDATLGSANDLLQRARELAVQGANDTLDTNQKADIAAEVDQLLQQMVQLGNATLKGQRLFAGLKTDANPFTLNAGPPTTVAYSGDNGQMLREIDVGTTMAINTPGNSVFAPAFAALISLRDNLRAGNSAAVRATDIPGVDAALDTVLTTRASVGAKVNRLQGAQDRQQQLQARITELLAKTEDTDYTAAISDFTQQDTVYKASLQAAAKALQPSLMDYLR